MKYRTVLLFGAPGSGKGTQGKVLANIPGFFHCACGDIFRNLKVDSDLGRVFVHYSSKGQLVPDDATIRLWRDFIETSTKIGRFHPEKNLLVLDGIPRNITQAKILRDVLDVRAMFWLKTRDFEALVRRIQRRALKENRLDDMNLEVIRSRMETYENETQPLVDYYGKKLVHRVTSDQTPVEVCRDILAKIIRLGIQPRL
ncbi:MAG TPA: nucleoside monophosphate kinase [Verrucomicrobiae bacterium]|nr:nucleoside monophosphate kinase [Verrucomicrobiae bacterium]